MRDLLTHWNIRSMPFDNHYLNFMDDNFYDLFVSTDSVLKLDELFPSIIGINRERSMLVLGERSSGKSTLLNYLLLKIIKANEKNVSEQRVFPMLLNLKNPEAYRDVGMLSAHFFSRLVRSMIYSLSNSKDINFNPYKSSFIDLISDLERVKKDKERDSELIIDQIDEAANRIGSHFNRSILLVDNFDKTSENHPEIVEDFFSQIQGFVEDTLWSNKIYTVFVGPAFWLGMDYSRNAEFAWIYNSFLEVKRWNYEQIRELLSNRLENSSLSNKFSLDEYFSEDSIRYIYNFNDGNPRLCLNSAKSCLFDGWKENAARINLKFLHTHPSCIRGSLDGNEVKTYLELEKRINNDKNNFAAYNKLRSLFAENKTQVLPLISDILHIYKNEGIGRRDIANFDLLLSNKFILTSDERKLSNVPVTERKMIVLDPQAKRLLNIIYEVFDGNEKRVQSFVIRQFGV